MYDNLDFSANLKEVYGKNLKDLDKDKFFAKIKRKLKKKKQAMPKAIPNQD